MKSKDYDFKQIEKSVIQFWNQLKLPNQTDKDDFKIIMPPPNVTGSLHLGHALNSFLQDTLIRHARLQNKKTLWIPGFDHAGIATEIMVKKWITENNWKIKNKNDLKNYFQQWVEEQKTQITHQWKKLGLMINLDKVAYTFSEYFQKVVKETFVDLYQQDLIYRAKKLINFDLKLQTVLSDIEVVHKEQIGKLYYIKYWNAEKTAAIVVATTRPETIFADQALLIHPDDSRAEKWSKQKVINPLTDQLMPVFKERTVDRQFGTGILKCTPGHDFIDFTIGQKLQLQTVSCFDQQGLLNKVAQEFFGIDRLAARDKIVAKLKQKQQLQKVINIKHKLPYSSKSDTLLEPMISNQWFLKTKEWAKKLLTIQNQITFVPKKYQLRFVNWLKNCQDWCISRQLNWGHRIPVYFHDDGRIKVDIKQPTGNGWKQSDDVLDTWFSSALWSLINGKEVKSTIDNKNPVHRFNYLVTSYDIIFFWVTKMLFFHYHFTGKIPFQKILIHGLVRDQNNEKMSKSKGNVLDPLILINKFGVDSLRIYLLGDYKIGEDLKFNASKLVQAKQFCHKLWNINYFISAHAAEIKNFCVDECQSDLNHYIYQQLLKLFQTYQRNFMQHRWSVVVKKVIEFVWKDFSNLYLELAKVQLQNDNQKEETRKMITFIWKQVLILLHPFVPFLTEYIWQQDKTNNTDSILQERLKFENSKSKKTEKGKSIQALLTIIKKVNFFIDKRQDKVVEIVVHTQKISFYQQHQGMLNRFLQKRKIKITQIKKDIIERIVPVDRQRVVNSLETRITLLRKELERSEKILNNKAFLAKAKKKVVREELMKEQNWKKELRVLLNEVQLLK